VELLPIVAVAPGQAAPVLAAAERGRRLFVAKGCVSCHLHGDVPGSGKVQVGPELTALRLPADFLQKFLADPSIAPVAAGTTFRMPNLNLKESEIAALAAFINGAGGAPRAGQ
jgi:mono/diheme cytochrome c family protein